jgi:site-specific DNA-methyltransferase (adenine-specific)
MTRKRLTKAKPATPLLRSKYQIFPPHPAAVHQALHASITQHGVENPTTWDDEGNLLDGWERESICAALGRNCPREVRHFDSEAAKFQLILAVNAHRRPSLSQRQKRAVIEAYLQGDAAVADNMLGETLGVSKNTVLAVRQRLEASRKIPKLNKTRGKDGKLRPVRYTRRIVTNTPTEFRKAQEIIKDLPDNCAGRTLDITTAKRRAATNRNKEERESRRIAMPLPADAIRLYHCRFQELEQVAGIVPASAKLFLTDFPYGADFLPQLEDLAALAQRLLVEGGLVVTYTGNFYLPQVLAAFSNHLTYRWMAASIWDGDGNLIHPLDITSQWKPILIYSKGEWVKRGRWPDVLRNNSKEKSWHPWQQPLGEVESLLSFFSQPGDLVIDPCGGGFTTAEACLRLGRRCVSCDVDAVCVSKGLDRLERARNSMTLGA